MGAVLFVGRRVFPNGSVPDIPSSMTRIQLFYSRAYPGNTLRANTLQALAHLGVNPEMQVEETVPEQTGTPLPALAIDGEIVVYGVEPSVHELELLLQDRVQEREADFPCGACGMGCSGMNGPENCPMCIQDGKDGSMAGRIIGFAILLMLLFLAMKILS